jgi:L-seryl-tRNA(Ser) seleniumtransferase
LNNSPLRRLPAVHAVLDQPILAALRPSKGREVIVEAVRAVIQQARQDLDGGHEVAVDIETLARRAAQRLSSERPWLRPVVNATGVLLNTGLGRAPLAAEAAEAVDRVVRGYCNLEFDLDQGDRGQRTAGVEELLCRVTRAEAAAVVNNNAGGTILALRAVAAGREVIISRGQLIEIGGSFRLPEIFRVSGARLREVGTTNKTRLADYAEAIGPDTAALLRVHPSNYRIVGFTEDVPIADLARLAHERGLVAIDDIGSGALAPGCPPVVRNEPTAAAGLAAGADMVLFSGDKLLGGPQCGILVGTRAVIGQIRSDPLMRALRVDKMTLAALEATLRLVLDPALARERIPLWSLLTKPIEQLRDRAERMATTFRTSLGLNAEMAESTAFLGGGSTPVEPIPTAVIRVGPPFPAPWTTETAFARALRMGDPPVVARLHEGCVLFDLRALTEPEDRILEEAIRKLLNRDSTGSRSSSSGCESPLDTDDRVPCPD